MLRGECSSEEGSEAEGEMRKLEPEERVGRRERYEGVRESVVGMVKIGMGSGRGGRGRERSGFPGVSIWSWSVGRKGVAVAS